VQRGGTSEQHHFSCRGNVIKRPDSAAMASHTLMALFHAQVDKSICFLMVGAS